MIGGLSNYRKAIANLNAIRAPLKPVIAGNHDESLDAKWWEENLDEDDDPDEPAKTLALFKEQGANGMYLLSEGIHSFDLEGGKRLRVYASPYTPEFGGYAFGYGKEEGRFGRDGAENPIPTRGDSEGEIDIVMTHGPLWCHQVLTGASTGLT